MVVTSEAYLLQCVGRLRRLLLLRLLPRPLEADLTKFVLLHPQIRHEGRQPLSICHEFLSPRNCN